MLDFSSPDFYLHVDLGLLILLCCYMYILVVIDVKFFKVI